MPTRRTTSVPPAVRVSTRGPVPEAAKGYAERKIGHVHRHTTEPVLSTHVVLTQARDPARVRPALAEASLRFDAAEVRAQASAGEMTGAVDLVADRLQRVLRHHQDRQQTRHRWLATRQEHEWRHGTLPDEQVDHYRRPAEEREVLRRKTFALDPISLDEAAFDMDMLGHDFYLFTDRDSGRDALVHRTAAGGLAVRGVPGPAGSVVVEGPAPVLDEAEARERLELSGEPFVFYTDRDTGRGRVLYVRYDGHYGLILAA